MHWNYKKYKKVELGGDWAELETNICLLRPWRYKQTRAKYLEENRVIQ